MVQWDHGWIINRFRGPQYRYKTERQIANTAEHARKNVHTTLCEKVEYQVDTENATSDPTCAIDNKWLFWRIYWQATTERKGGAKEVYQPHVQLAEQDPEPKPDRQAKSRERTNDHRSRDEWHLSWSSGDFQFVSPSSPQ